MSSEYRNNPPTLNYSPKPEFITIVKEVIAQESLVLIKGFPIDKNAFVGFSKQIGSLMANYRAKGDGSADDYIQEVRIRTDIPPEERLSTERDGEFKPHTAKSWGVSRPELFGLLMINPGWRDNLYGNNGESFLVRWRDVFLEMSERFPDNYHDDWEFLKGTDVIFTATHLPDPPANEPLVTELSSPFDIGVRYKENMVSVIEKLIPTFPNGERFHQAVVRFEEVAKTTAARFEFSMEPGDSYFVDNRRVGHARRPFESYRVDSAGQMKYNPRLLLNIHILNVSR